MKQLFKRIPIIHSIALSIYRKWINPPKPFDSSENYWIERYESGGNSGIGSYKELAEFKSRILNGFVRKEDVKTIIEYGCGDGNQLKFAEYPFYIGFDVSPQAIIICKEIFSKDAAKAFKMMNDYKDETAQLTLSLDVIYHLIEDDIFNEHMYRLFNSSEKFVIIYSSNTNKNRKDQAVHVKQRKFTDWIENTMTGWKLIEYIPNKYPFNTDNKTGSISDFYIYRKA